MKRKKSMLEYLVVSLDDLKELEKAGVFLSFSFWLDGKYLIQANKKRCEEILGHATNTRG